MIIIPRIARKDLNTPFIHVMIQGINKEFIFENEYFIKKYLDIFQKNKCNYDFTLIAYCMMINHAHFLIYTEDIQAFGRFMHKTNLQYSNFYNGEKNRVGVVFRNKYRAEPIYNMSYLLNCIIYIHNNPVKANLVKKCEDYKYSSYRDFINNTGSTQSKIMKSIFEPNYDYLSAFNSTIERKFMDIENSLDESIINQYISNGIQEFSRKYSKSLIDIFSNESILKKVIFFLHNSCKFKYVDLQNYFSINKSKMEALKK